MFVQECIAQYQFNTTGITTVRKVKPVGVALCKIEQKELTTTNMGKVHLCRL